MALALAMSALNLFVVGGIATTGCTRSTVMVLLRGCLLIWLPVATTRISNYFALKNVASVIQKFSKNQVNEAENCVASDRKHRLSNQDGR